MKLLFTFMIKLIRQKEDNEVSECIYTPTLFTAKTTYTDTAWHPCWVCWQS